MRVKRSSAVRIGLGGGIAALMLAAWAVVPGEAAKNHRPRLSISVLSGRADLVSGGSALVAIDLPRRTDARHVRITLRGRNVTRAFAIRQDGRFEGLVTHLAVGANVLQATLPSGWRARLTLVNHPAGGPVFSGP